MQIQVKIYPRLLSVHRRYCPFLPKIYNKSILGFIPCNIIGRNFITFNKTFSKLCFQIRRRGNIIRIVADSRGRIKNFTYVINFYTIDGNLLNLISKIYFKSHKCFINLDERTSKVILEQNEICYQIRRKVWCCNYISFCTIFPKKGLLKSSEIIEFSGGKTKFEKIEGFLKITF